jgi:hypothetical protein
MRRERHAEDVAELAIKVRHPALRMIDGADDDVTQPAQSFGEKAQGDALAAARLAGDHHKSAVPHGPLDAPAKGFHRGHHVERFDRDFRTEGVKL